MLSLQHIHKLISAYANHWNLFYAHDLNARQSCCTGSYGQLLSDIFYVMTVCTTFYQSTKLTCYFQHHWCHMCQVWWMCHQWFSLFWNHLMDEHSSYLTLCSTLCQCFEITRVLWIVYKTCTHLGLENQVLVNLYRIPIAMKEISKIKMPSIFWQTWNKITFPFRIQRKAQKVTYCAYNVQPFSTEKPGVIFVFWLAKKSQHWVLASRQVSSNSVQQFQNDSANQRPRQSILIFRSTQKTHTW